MRYTFTDCRLDTASRELTVKDTSVHLSPKAFELLCLLIKERPRVVPKGELMNALWPDTFVVDANLPVIVGELRSALGDRASGTSAIKTHHGIGYSFVADVREKRSAAASAGPASVRWVLRLDGRRIALGQGLNKVGRDENCEAYLNHASVSRHHARLTVHGDRVTVEDLGSKNGTRVNTERITSSRRVADGDEIEFGTVRTRLVAKRLASPSTLTM
jgi:DNA-binding winged helix-turn-helix (wHTH) protein